MVLERVIPTKTLPVEMRLDISITSAVINLLFVCFPAAWCNIMTSSKFMMTKNKQVSYSCFTNPSPRPEHRDTHPYSADPLTDIDFIRLVDLSIHSTEQMIHEFIPLT